MKNILRSLIAIVLLTVSAHAATLVTATITVTNVPGVGSNFIVNANTRTWTNAAGTPLNAWITVGASVGATATNLFNHIASYPYLTPYLLTLSRSSTNVIILRGSSISVTTNNYMSVSYVTNVGTNLSVVQVPFEAVVGATNRTNNAHWLVDAFNTYPYTNAFRTNANVITNLLVKGAHPYQEVLGPVGFRGRTAVNSNFFATNGFTSALTNINPVTSNLVNYGNAIRSEGSGGNSLQVGSNALANGAHSMAIGNGSLASNLNSLAIGRSAIATNGGAAAIGNSAYTTGDNGTAIGNSANAAQAAVAVGAASALGTEAVAVGDGSQAQTNAIGIGFNAIALAESAISIGNAADSSAAYAVAVGASATASHSNSAAIGPVDHASVAVSTTTTNQIRLGTANHTVSIPGQLLVSGTASNLTTRGTNILSMFAATRANVSSIANGVNIAVPIGTNRFIRLSGTVTGSPTIAGMVGSATTGAMDGHEVLIHNDLGYDCAFVQTTSDPVPANRIETFDGNDIIVANNGWILFNYSGADSRWHAVTYYPIVGTATNNAISSWTNGVAVSSAATNINIIAGTNVVLLATNNGGRADIQINAAGNMNRLLAITNDIVITNTTSLTGALSNYQGTVTIPANWWQVGSVVRIRFHGRYFNGSTVTHTNRITLGGSIVATNHFVLISTLSDNPYNVNVTLMCRSIGSSGSVIANGTLDYPTSASGGLVTGRRFHLASGAVTINTTIANDIGYDIHPGATTQAFYFTSGDVVLER